MTLPAVNRPTTSFEHRHVSAESDEFNKKLSTIKAASVRRIIKLENRFLEELASLKEENDVLKLTASMKSIERRNGDVHIISFLANLRRYIQAINHKDIYEELNTSRDSAKNELNQTATNSIPFILKNLQKDMTHLGVRNVENENLVYALNSIVREKDKIEKIVLQKSMLVIDTELDKANAKIAMQQAQIRNQNVRLEKVKEERNKAVKICRSADQTYQQQMVSKPCTALFPL